MGLKFINAKGATVVFPGVALREPAHYAAAVVIAEPGVWKVYGVQGPFADYLVGTLTVPGGLTVLPMPPPMPVDPGQQYWGAVQPPKVPIDSNRPLFDDPVAVTSAPAASTAAQASAAAAVAPQGPGRSGWLGLTVALVGAVGVLAFVVVRQRRQTAQPPPADSDSDRELTFQPADFREE